MSGSKMISMALDEMRAACERGEDQTDWDRIRRMVRDNIEPAQDKDAPDASNLIQAEIDKRRRGRPFGSGKKKSKSRSVITMKFWIISSQQEMGGKPGWMRFYTIGLKHKPGPVEKQNSISYLMQYLQIVMRMIII